MGLSRISLRPPRTYSCIGFIVEKAIDNDVRMNADDEDFETTNGAARRVTIKKGKVK